MEITEAIYERGAPSKNTQWAEADCASYGGIKREEKPPCHPTPIRAALASEREIIQATLVMIPLVQKRHA